MTAAIPPPLACPINSPRFWTSRNPVSKLKTFPGKKGNILGNTMTKNKIGARLVAKPQHGSHRIHSENHGLRELGHLQTLLRTPNTQILQGVTQYVIGRTD